METAGEESLMAVVEKNYKFRQFRFTGNLKTDAHPESLGHLPKVLADLSSKEVLKWPKKSL